MLTSCEHHMPLRSTPYLSIYHRRRCQISQNSVISEKGPRNDRISPAQLLLKSQTALTDVCAKEGRNLMKHVWIFWIATSLRVHIENAALKSSLFFFLRSAVQEYLAILFLEIQNQFLKSAKLVQKSTSIDANAVVSDTA